MWPSWAALSPCVPVRINWRLVFTLAAAAFAVYVIVGIIRAGGSATPPPSSSQQITLRGCKGYGNRISTRSWSFQCDRATLSPDGITATIEGVHDAVLYKNGKRYLKMSAKNVTINTQTFDFNALGTVHIDAIPSNGSPARSFETDLVQWTNATKMLLLPHPCIVHTGDATLKVANLSVDFNKSQVHMGRIEGALEAPGP